jgi:hypothetical protein
LRVSVREVIKLLLGSPGLKERVMRKRDSRKSVSNDLNQTRPDFSAPIKWDKFSMQIAMEPYCHLGTGERCKIKHCRQPVYSKKSGLCAYHRMKEAEIEFEEGLRARQQSQN